MFEHLNITRSDLKKLMASTETHQPRGRRGRKIEE
jgi:hypothetical protein